MATFDKMWQVVVGKPLDPLDPRTRHAIAVTPLLAWVGLGADGLSSSCYGPEEAFLALGQHTPLALFLALATAATVFIIALGYNQVIELFPTGGGGYRVATALLGQRAGLVSGAALLVDYVLTVATSLASGVDAFFSLLPLSAQAFKLTTELILIVLMTGLNFRGMRESILVLLPIFLGFVVLHFGLIVYGVAVHGSGLTAVVPDAVGEAHTMSQTLGPLVMLALLMRAFSLGGGTYTGLEAVSNNVNMLAEPRTPHGKRTMLYMSTSLAFTAGGIILLYMLWHAKPVEGQTLNAVVFGSVIHGEARDMYLSRVAAIDAGLPVGTPCLTVNRLCGSGLQAIVSAAQHLLLGDTDTVVAGGAESMSRAAYFLPAGRWGQRMGDGAVVDAMTGALHDPFGHGHMGITAENIAAKFGFTRDQQDEFALESHRRAANALEKGFFKEQITPVEIKGRKGVETFVLDEHVRKGAKIEDDPAEQDGAQDGNDGGPGRVYADSIDSSWLISAYDPAFTTPDWAKGAVVYQIFPDRFGNADPRNDGGAQPRYKGVASIVPWNTLPATPPKGEDFYGGDLDGIRLRLPHLVSIGVDTSLAMGTTIWDFLAAHVRRRSSSGCRKYSVRLPRNTGLYSRCSSPRKASRSAQL